MAVLADYCLKHTTDRGSKEDVAGLVVNEAFYAACLLRCCFLLKRIKKKQAREGGVRRGRTRAIIAAIVACAFGIAYSAVSYSYKDSLQFDEKSRNLSAGSKQNRLIYRCLQTCALCFFSMAFFYLYQRLIWLMSKICNLPDWLNVYLKFSYPVTLLSAVTSFVLSICMVTKLPDLVFATDVSCLCMLIIICLHFGFCIRVALNLAEQKLLSQELDPGSHFDPRSKIRVVRGFFVAICVIIILRSILILLSAIGIQNENSDVKYCDKEQGAAVLLSRIIENDPFIQPILSSFLEPITLLFAFQKLGSGQNSGQMGSAHALKEAQRLQAEGIKVSHSKQETGDVFSFSGSDQDMRVHGLASPTSSWDELL